MTGAMMMERALGGMLTMGSSPLSAPGQTAAASMLMVPRCTMKFEKTKDGLKLTCSTTDLTACAMMQNLCTMLAGSLGSLCCMRNGMMVCTCNLMMGYCKVEMTNDGCCVACISGDQNCCEMIQGCYDSIMACMKAGCTCCFMLAGTPVCCGTN